MVTLLSTSVTLSSSLTGCSWTPVLSSTRWVADPHGTGFWQITTLSPGLFRSAKDPICFGLPGAVTMTNVLAAKFVGLPFTRPALTTVSICAVSADAKTSAVAPCVN
ncbi:Uncharacterised protein [Mycobacterium tuberculosis]|nr:Uncharacterised protein [Mycobacterium tuberculosis]